MKLIHITTNTLVCAVVLAIASCGSSTAPGQEDALMLPETVTLNKTQIEKAGIITDTMHYKHLFERIQVNGSIDVPPQNMVSVSMPLGGFLKYTKLLPGMHIKKGEVIAEMEDQLYIQLQQDYLTAKSDLVYLEKDFSRQGILNQSGAGSDKVFEQSGAAYKARKIALKALSEKLRLLGIDPLLLNENNISRVVSIRSPIAGYVSSVKVNVGRYVNPTDVLFELVNPDDIHLNLTVFEKDLNRIAIGQKVNAFSNADPSKKYPCDIILIGQNVSPERHIEVHCHFDHYDKTLIPGMYMQAEIMAGGNAVLCISEKAIQSFQGRDFVFIDQGNLHYLMQEVTCGIRDNGYVELMHADALKGSKFVLQGAYALLMKLKNTAE